MAETDVVDEAIIDANPATIYRALLDEFMGSTNWWTLHWEAKPRGDTPVGHVGAIMDIAVRRADTTRFTAKTTEIIENQLIHIEFVEGDFLVADAVASALRPLSSSRFLNTLVFAVSRQDGRQLKRGRAPPKHLLQ